MWSILELMSRGPERGCGGAVVSSVLGRSKLVRIVGSVMCLVPDWRSRIF
ncbi:hypothetical protein YC2023_059771 [Brassica napus]